MKSTSVNASSQVTLLDDSVMATINKLKNQHKRGDPASIYKELTKNLEPNYMTEDQLKNGNNSPIIAQTDPAFDHVYEP